jgi:aspartyl/glutamyl-tRNA(Asn/Gln) amidotransferase C subunit
MSAINEKDIDRLAELSRIDVPMDERTNLVKEIDSILAYIDEVKKAPIDFDPSPKPGMVKNVIREDIDKSTNPGDLISSAPQREGDYIVVKKILS